jgi:hypothetical protein
MFYTIGSYADALNIGPPVTTRYASNLISSQKNILFHHVISDISILKAMHT